MKQGRRSTTHGLVVVVDVSTAVRERAAVAERGSGASPALPTLFFAQQNAFTVKFAAVPFADMMTCQQPLQLQGLERR